MKLATLAVTLAAGAIVSLPAQADEALAKKYMCLICHTLDKKLVGPSYHDVATKYGCANAQVVPQSAADLQPGDPARRFQLLPG